MHFNSNIEKLEGQLKEQQKIINYYKECYKNQTGNDLSMPQSWSQFQNLQDSEAPLMDNIPDLNNYEKMDNDELGMLAKTPMPKFDPKTGKVTFKENFSSENFLQALYKLNLPNMKKQDNSKKIGGAAKTKKGDLVTTFDTKNVSHMVTKIDLSNYRHKEFTTAAFKEFIESVNDMRCQNTLILKNNGISDEHLRELDAIFSNKKITKIDLSQNEIGKKGILSIAKLLKKNRHLEWLDISRNDFSHEQQAIAMLEIGLRDQKNLYHLCIDMSSKDLNAKLDKDPVEHLEMLSFNRTYIATKPAQGKKEAQGKKQDFLKEEQNPDKFDPSDKNPMEDKYGRYNKFVVCENIAHQLESNPKLKSLCMIDSKITGNAMRFIRKALKDPKKFLSNLSFKFCNLGKFFC